MSLARDRPLTAWLIRPTSSRRYPVARYSRSSVGPWPSAGAGKPAIAQAARTVLASRQAIVIGPTPPGTGVIAPAISVTSAKATSPTMRDLPPSCRHPVDADVDHGGAGLDPIAPHHLRSSDRREQHVGAAADRRQIARLGMRHRHRRVLRQQELRQRLADDVGAADHHRLEPGERRLHGLGEKHAADRRAWRQRRQARATGVRHSRDGSRRRPLPDRSRR